MKSEKSCELIKFPTEEAHILALASGEEMKVLFHGKLTGFYPKLKSFWYCSHMNCCQHYMLHINLLCLLYVCSLLIYLASPSLDGICPIQALTGTTPDISFLVCFSFWEPVYYRVDSHEPASNSPSPMKRKVTGLGLQTMLGVS